jgi:cytochrome c oxidase subunit IV
METFFTIYFIVVGVLFTLNLISVLIKFFTADGEDWQLHLADDVLE